MLNNLNEIFHKRRVSKLLFVLFLGAVCISMMSLSPSKKGRKIKKAYRQELYEGSLSKMYEYMFESLGRRDTGLNLGGRQYGRFMAGFKGLVLYTRFTESIIAIEGVERAGRGGFYSLRSLEALSGGIKPFISGETSFKASYEREEGDSLFHYYNPKYIDWAGRNLIPNPDEAFFGIKSSEIYDKIFRRFFRLLTDAYLLLHFELDAEYEIGSYFAKMQSDDFRAFEYLDDKYGMFIGSERFAAYGMSQNYSSLGIGGFLTHSSFDAALGLGFWCRRGIDESDDNCWRALSKIMALYDADWLALKMSELREINNK